MKTIGNAGSTARRLKAVASGALPNGQPVVVNADGTVSVVAETSSAESIPAGSEAVFNSSFTDATISISFDPNTAGKFVVVYHDGGNSGYGTASIGTVSGTTISYGSKYVFNSDATLSLSVDFDPNTSGKFVVSYKDGSGTAYGTAIVGTVSGTTISFGSESVFNSAATTSTFVTFDPNTVGKLVVAYQDDANSGYGTAVVGTVSGTSISFGSEYVFNSSNTVIGSASFDPNTAGKFVVAYRDGGNSNHGTAIVGTVSGTTISFGSEYVFNNASTASTSVTFAPNTAGKFVVAYRDDGNSSYGTAVVGTVSGTTISFGSESVFNSASTNVISASFDFSAAGKFVVAYRDDGNSFYGTASIGTVSGTTISFGSESVFNSARSEKVDVAFDPNTFGNFVVSYSDGGNSSYGTAIVGQASVPVTNLTSENYIGLASNGYPDTAGATIDVQGAINDRQSGLTAGQAYYVQTDGTLSETAGTPSVFAGTAISATKMIVKG